MNANFDSYRLHNVVMPLVRLIAEENLSWADKEKCAEAIIQTHRHHRDLMAESNKLADCGGCAPAQNCQPEER